MNKEAQNAESSTEMMENQKASYEEAGTNGKEYQVNKKEKAKKERANKEEEDRDLGNEEVLHGKRGKAKKQTQTNNRRIQISVFKTSKFKAQKNCGQTRKE
jgi:hypothetical protein